MISAISAAAPPGGPAHARARKSSGERRLRPGSAAPAPAGSTAHALAPPPGACVAKISSRMAHCGVTAAKRRSARPAWPGRRRCQRAGCSGVRAGRRAGSRRCRRPARRRVEQHHVAARAGRPARPSRARRMRGVFGRVAAAQVAPGGCGAGPGSAASSSKVVHLAVAQVADAVGPGGGQLVQPAVAVDDEGRPPAQRAQHLGQRAGSGPGRRRRSAGGWRRPGWSAGRAG